MQQCGGYNCVLLVVDFPRVTFLKNTMTDTVVEFDALAAVAEIAAACELPEAKVAGAVKLLEEGATLPFIARYRKEATGGLDETQLRAVEDALDRLRELAARKKTILATIDGQGLLTGQLREKILACNDKKLLEEIYLPFKPKRRTRGAIARERGLEPLAQQLLSATRRDGDRDKIAQAFVNASKDVPDVAAAIAGACDIVAEQWSELPESRSIVRDQTKFAQLTAKAKRGWKDKPSKFEMYYEHTEPLSRAPSHRFLAMRRGEAEGVLNVGMNIDAEYPLRKLRNRLLPDRDALFHQELSQTVEDCYERLLLPSIESETLTAMKERAEEEAINVFSQNLRELLLAPPVGPKAIMGVDPGFRTGCKVAVVDATGKFLENAAIYPTPPRSDTRGAAKVVAELVKKHNVELIALGNGTASRETDAFLEEAIRANGLKVDKVTVSESGASIYSASEAAAAEYPDLDVTVRGAISIAHRLQDPLAELVKIDPKSIGVGQYQHDVNQTRLKKALDREVSSCVNRVGVDLNTASVQLLSYVAGIGPSLASAIAAYRDEHGAFANRKQLLKVPRLGAKAFEQAAGFLRVRGGKQPLDNSAVHPERYTLVQKMAGGAAKVPALIGDASRLAEIDPQKFVDAAVGLPTIRDILGELEKPGRDPRAQFRVAKFADGVNEVSDLHVGMKLEGVVTNVTKFGAFVDIGVHQDGLVHISELDNRYIDEPSQVVSVGDIIQVEVLQIDAARKRIGLSRKSLLGGG